MNIGLENIFYQKFLLGIAVYANFGWTEDRLGIFSYLATRLISYQI
jgi:hypothetical protein